MSTFAAFIIGLLVGWVIEWIIDWVYWRRKSTPEQPGALERCRRQVTSLEEEIASYKSQLAVLQADVSRSARVPVVQETVTPAAVETRAAAQARAAEPIAASDRLETIGDLTAEMIQRLKQAGIDTVAKLGALVPKRLKEILGDLIPQQDREVEIVRQARLASGMMQKADDLEVIVGIGPVIARTLNQAGIFTFQELATLTAQDLREIVGKQIQRLADEDEILSQARELAEKQNRGG